MDVSGALPEAIILEFRDEEWIQSIYYENILFRCRKCHEHRHLLRECPLNKRREVINPKTQQDEEGFITSNPRNRANKKQNKTSAGNTQETQNTIEGRDQTNKGTAEDNDSAKVPEVKDQATK